MQARPLVQVTHLNSRNAFILLAVMMFIVLSIVLANVAFVQSDEFSEDYEFDDFLVINNWMAIWTTLPFFQMLSMTIPWMGVSVVVLCAADLGGGILAPPQFSA